MRPTIDLEQAERRWDEAADEIQRLLDTNIALLARVRELEALYEAALKALKERK